MELTGSHRKHLRGLAHRDKPAVHVGKEGLTDSVVAEIDRAITARELVKVKIFGEREERKAMVPMIEGRLGCVCVGLVGQVAILYRQNPDPDKRRITFPA
jgi:RNA-binding protein